MLKVDTLLHKFSHKIVLAAALYLSTFQHLTEMNKNCTTFVRLYEIISMMLKGTCQQVLAVFAVLHIQGIDTRGESSPDCVYPGG